MSNSSTVVPLRQPDTVDDQGHSVLTLVASFRASLRCSA